MNVHRQKLTHRHAQFVHEASQIPVADTRGIKIDNRQIDSRPIDKSTIDKVASYQLAFGDFHCVSLTLSLHSFVFEIGSIQFIT